MRLHTFLEPSPSNRGAIQPSRDWPGLLNFSEMDALRFAVTKSCR